MIIVGALGILVLPRAAVAPQAAARRGPRRAATTVPAAGLTAGRTREVPDEQADDGPPARRTPTSRIRKSPTAPSRTRMPAQPPPPPPAQPRLPPDRDRSSTPYPAAARPASPAAPGDRPGLPRTRRRRRPPAPAPPPPSADAAPARRRGSGIGPRHGRTQGGQPRPSSRPARDTRRRRRQASAPAPPPTAFLPPAPAGYPQPSFQPFDYRLGAAAAAPRFTPVDARHRAGRPGQPHQDPRAGRSAQVPATGPQRAADDTSPNLARSSKAMALGTVASRGTGFLRTLVLVVALGRRPARRRLQQLQHAAEHRVLPDARRHLHLGRGPAAGPRGQGRPGPGRGVRGADLLTSA